MNPRKVLFPFLVYGALSGCSVDLPNPPAPLKNKWANQGWNNAERHWYHHASQGTNTFGLPYEWFKALEQPEFSLSEVGLMSDQQYLARMGFIPSPTSVDEQAAAQTYGFDESTKGDHTSYYDGKTFNQANLPVGFAVGDEWFDPASGRHWPIPGTGKNAHSLGLTCAACHTGQLEFGDNRILIDGGQGMISLDKFREALKLSLAYTKILPGRFDRFAKRVLGTAYNDQNAAMLKGMFDSFLDQAKVQGGLEADMIKQGVSEGFTRLDALNRIGNEVFGSQMKLPQNMYPIAGPVSFPFIWNAPWLDWVQYNSSIQQPMVRNAGEAMGVKGLVNLTNPQKQVFDSKLPLETLHDMEFLLAGDKHPLDGREFGGLHSPDWRKLPLPPLDEALVAKGRDLYMGNPDKNQKPLCAGCHLPPVNSAEIFDDKYWKTPGPGYDQKYLGLTTIPVKEIGTDCQTAFGMLYRTVETPNFIKNSGTVIPPLGPGQTPGGCPQPSSSRQAQAGYTVTNFGVALGEVVEKTKETWYNNNNIPADQRLKLDGYRPNGIRATVPGLPPQGVPVYEARPLNGAWSTGPYLHNGSVPNLYLLLSTQSERDAEASKFYLGSREFDARYLGYKYRADGKSTLPGVEPLRSTQGLFELDTNLPGNRNTGHLFTNDSAEGRIGPQLSRDDRMALIEFLKSL